MLNLANTTDKLQLTTSSTADISVHASWVDYVKSPESATPDRTHTAINTATTTDIVAAPAASTYRNVKFLSFRNKHASSSNDLTVIYDQNGTDFELFKATLAAGEELVCREGVWFVFDTTGAVKTDAVLASDTVPGRIEIATQAEMEAGSSTTLAVTPGRQHFHPSAAKSWCDNNGAGTVINASYNITSLTDTGTGRCGVNIATDMSAANYAVVFTLERSVTSLAEAGVEDSQIRNASQAAGAYEMESYDHTATTMAAQDPASYFSVTFGDQA